ncbi:ferritin-like domain-containing protein [Kitasatospora sp. NPDC048540]|uniref:ferritin-like domain-containing protein n=1 Tax=unclassified Kitasatospora TaxID=2633591 RepID=UPI0006894EF9|nr:ferritin-like domain-containing protein [Kitasatospora sp. MBT63]
MTESPTAAPQPIPSQAPLDVQVLQTAAALENLAVTSYTSAEALPFLAGDGNAHLRELIARNKAHHAAHATAFNQAVTQAGAAPQHTADMRYAASVGRMLGQITDPTHLVALLTELEGINAQTCTRFATLTETGGLRSLFVNVASVEAQHGSELLIIRSLLDDGQAEPGAPRTAAHLLPPALGTAGIPHADYPTTDASAINEGVVR